MALRPVFLHSTWRTGSTYLWAKFRGLGDRLCYFEPLNEHLANATAAFIDAFEPWSYANHPTLDAPYLEEFRPLLDPNGGVAGFPADLTYGQYRLDRTAERPELVAYFRRLERHARDFGKAPVFGCVRTDLRIGWFHDHLDGVHIVIRRDPRRQFLSCLQQAVKGNRYFLERGPIILGNNPDDGDFTLLRESIALPAFDGPSDQRDDFYARQAWTTDWATLYEISYFLYRLSVIEVGAADLVIDMDRLSKTDGAIAEAERAIADWTGARLSLTDFRIERYEQMLAKFDPAFTAIERKVDALLP